jgi:DNA-binding SARP family transcriptional activator/pimeloyl-ACP methyl ester carboxylesterase
LPQEKSLIFGSATRLCRNVVVFRVLGPLEVSVAGEPLAVGGARTRGLLALLLLNANRVVPADTLADALWRGLAGDRAAANLQVRLSELRRALRTVGEADRLETRPPGYVLRVGEGELDAQRFERLVSAGHCALDRGDADAAIRQLDEALHLWRGEPLAGIDGGTLLSAERARLEEAQLGALELRIEAMLGSGRHRETVGELETLTANHPLHERFWHQRLMALYRSGRQAEALRAYRELREILVEELGIEPSPELRELEARILRQDPSLLSSRRPGFDREEKPVGQTRYVDSGGVHIAYQVIGEGDIDILFVPGLMSHVELIWEDPSNVAFFTRLAEMGRLILFDKRDTGLSDRTPGECTLEQRIEDAKAVMDAVSSERAIVFGYSEGAPMAILFAATYPEKVSALILGSAFARWFPAPDYPCGPGAERVYESMVDIATNRWGQGDTIEWFLPSRAGLPQARQAMGRFERMAISPSTYLRMIALIREIDVRAALPAIRVPTLVIHRQGDRINPPFYGRYIAEHIPGARYFEQPGDHALRFAESEELDAMIDEIQDFLAPTPTPTTPTREPTRALTTIMIVEGATGAGGIAQVRTHRGVVRTHSPGHLLATFDAPGQAIRCALAFRSRATSDGGALRVGIHSGEVEFVDNDIDGPSVAIAAGVAARADDREILVSRTVKDLVVGSEIIFTERGRHSLDKVPDDWELLAVDQP